ncbi:DUF2267 domain-containing protein [Streptomyces smyrnaeus]|uniref:DUF2267 domain-containing protein n=1 Tax=Streptomyces smyrnaeus TaxID=1387713 RepID=UPI003405B580
MKSDQFLAHVRDRGEYRDQAEAMQITEAVLRVLNSRITGGEAKDLASQLPEPIDQTLLESTEAAESFGITEFLRRVAERTGAQPGTAESDASAVLSTLAEAVSGGECNQLITQLPSSYAPLFGEPELAG